jgi:hypothetical protein
MLPVCMTVEKPWKLAKTRLVNYTTKHPIGPLSGAGFSYYAQHMGRVKQKMALRLTGEGRIEKELKRRYQQHHRWCAKPIKDDTFQSSS